MIITKTKIATMMLLVMVLFGSAGLLFSQAQEKPATGEKKEQSKEDSVRIQGKWVVISAEEAGRPIKDSIGDTFTLEKNKWTVKHDKRGDRPEEDSESGTFQLDPKKTPKQIDLTSDRAEVNGAVKGIYELDGDTLKICIGDAPEEGRPTKFATDPKRKKLALVVLKRAKE
jgi:uncharacterized protein (TIGR03067 family)